MTRLVGLYPRSAEWSVNSQGTNWRAIRASWYNFAPFLPCGCFVTDAHSHKIDRLAILLSALCLVHCLALPLPLLAAPVLAAWMTGTETTVHWILLAVAVPLSIWAFARGYRHTRDPVASWIGAVGLGLMFLGVSHLFEESLEIPLTLVGVGLVTTAHLRNIRNCRRSHEAAHA